MQTVHNALWTEVLVHTASRHFEAIYAGGMTVDNGESAPPEMLFEPWMRTEIGCWGELVDGKRVAFLRFRAGPEEAPFQEMLATVHEDMAVAIVHTIPNDEYRICEMVSNLIHLIAHQEASIAGRPGCCCPDQPDGAEHVHPEFIVPDVVIEEGSNIEVLKPTNIGRGLTSPILTILDAEAAMKRDNITPLRVVKNDAPGE